MKTQLISSLETTAIPVETIIYKKIENLEIFSKGLIFLAKQGIFRTIASWVKLPETCLSFTNFLLKKIITFDFKSPVKINFILSAIEF